MTITSKIGRRGQITVPKDVRERFGLHEGQTVAFVIRDGELTLTPLTRTLFDFEGAIAVDGPQDWDAVRVRVTSRCAEKIAAGT